MHTASPTASNPAQFQWKTEPEAQKLIDELAARFLQGCPPAAVLAGRMKNETATRFKDWIDHIAVPADAAMIRRLEAAGFTVDARRKGRCYMHPGAQLPPVVIGDDTVMRVGIKVDCIADFLAAQRITPAKWIEGGPLASLRKALAWGVPGHELWAVERHGTLAFAVEEAAAEKRMKSAMHLERFRTRNRNFADDAQGFAHMHELIDAAIADLGVDLACDRFFNAERSYWQSRCRAARIQKSRQDALGLGWSNHDHHTYRCRRKNFKATIGVFEKLGFHCRERFYAGGEAGWGAQVLEQPVSGVVIFADVDLSPEEIAGDFAHDGLPELGTRRTVGLWCELHGDSILQAGMHHLECMFDHDELVHQLEAAGVKTMQPFTDFPFLKQAFTQAEVWQVDDKRVQHALDKGYITADQAYRFRLEGAPGSHLENLERNDGFKGFNQKGVSHIIAKTDPRTLVGA